VIDRAALIEAASKAMRGGSCTYDSKAAQAIDAVLPLIADAIEAIPLRTETYPLAAGQVRFVAARSVRELGYLND
jgi:hypothetical protein